MVALSAQHSTLSNQLASLTTKAVSSSMSYGMDIIVGSSSSYPDIENDLEQAHYLNNQNFNYQPNNLPTHYHPCLRNHENFPYGNSVL